MIGKESLLKTTNPYGETKLFYVPSFFAEWPSVIAFSGTISEINLSQFKTEFPKSLTFQFPSLRANGESHYIDKIYSEPKDYKDLIVPALELAFKEFSNAVIIVPRVEELKELCQSNVLSKFDKKRLVIFDDFRSDFAKI
mmetsp:Transcript_16088/g.11601  ORF Transcript_16088/g.11601 Transcript_16088/m.11601 type:complete len:140 (-) Transcript_16088:577-996(-)